jgi:hypothetical protein
MAESDTILQLGIEAAREGNREEARNLFGLLTRQEPDNAQAWLWLAGVAEGPEQRRAALERVVQLDPNNEMAVKGLQAIGVTPPARSDQPAANAASAPPPAPAAPERPLTEEERYAAELDSAFDDYDTVPRAETPPRREPDETTEVLGSAAAADRAASSARTARERSAARRASTPLHSDEDDELRAAPARRPNSLLWILVGLAALLLVIFLLFRFLNRDTGGLQTAENATAAAETATAVAAGGGAGLAGTATTEQPGGTGNISGTGTLSGTESLTGTETLSGTGSLTGTETLSPTVGTEPTASTATAPAGPAQPPAPVANPNLQTVGIGTQLEANGWTYSYPDASYVLVLGKQVGNFTAQGTYIHVLVWVANNTGSDQPLPANFFALKDAQGAVYPAQPQVSSAAVQRGVNADRGLEDPIPANGVLTSVYLVFDVTPGAQNLVLFASGKNDQGWQVLNAVP